jgi:hypothetical protein
MSVYLFSAGMFAAGAATGVIIMCILFVGSAEEPKPKAKER